MIFDFFNIWISFSSFSLQSRTIMASRSKKAHLVLETPDNTESSSSSESDNSEAEEEEEMTSTDELQVIDKHMRCQI